MNYYIQGDASNADKIRVAFEKLGYDTSRHLFNAKSVLYFTLNIEIRATTCNCTPAIIKTHPDYKELELPVEPKFKVGDRVIYNGIVRTITFMDEIYYDFDGGVAGCRIELQDKLKPASNFKKGDLLVHNNEPTCRVLVVDVSEKYGYQLQDGGSRYHLSFTTIEKEYHLWTIKDAKDGDILVTTKVRSCPFIYRKTSYNNNLAYYYAGIDGNGDFCEGCLKRTLSHFGSVENVVPATKEQRDLLFAKMKEAGYEWDADKKELRKIQPYYDIKNFKPKQWVLVRDDDEWEWGLTRFSHLSNGSVSLFVCINGASFQQCIPYDGNEHLLGTTDMCPEKYINW